MNFDEASAVELQLLADLKEHVVEWANMLQNISDNGGAAMANTLSLNEKYLQKVDRALQKHGDLSEANTSQVGLIEVLEAAKAHIVSFNRYFSLYSATSAIGRRLACFMKNEMSQKLMRRYTIGVSKF